MMACEARNQLWVLLWAVLDRIEAVIFDRHSMHTPGQDLVCSASLASIDISYSPNDGLEGFSSPAAFPHFAR